MVKINSEKVILEADLFNVVEFDLTFPPNIHKVYKAVKRNPAVGVFPLTDDGFVYLVQQERYLLEKKTIEPVAGFIDQGEEPMDAAIRELKEETGFMAQKITHLTTYSSAASIATWQMHLFVATGLQEGAQALEEDEEIGVIKLSLDECVSKVMNGEIFLSSGIIGILMIDRLKKEGKI